MTDRSETNFFEGEPLHSLSTLSYSENVDLQRSAALAFAEITEKDVQAVERDTLEPILYLLGSSDVEVQRAASAALGNLAVNADNKLLIVVLGGLEPLIRQMLSANVEVQCNAVGCITNLATHDDNKPKIAKSGALVPLTRLAKSKDMRVQRNATGALLNMTHSGAPFLLRFIALLFTCSHRREPTAARQRRRHPRTRLAALERRYRRPVRSSFRALMVERG